MANSNLPSNVIVRVAKYSPRPHIVSKQHRLHLEFSAADWGRITEWVGTDHLQIHLRRGLEMGSGAFTEIVLSEGHVAVRPAQKGYYRLGASSNMLEGLAQEQEMSLTALQGWLAVEGTVKCVVVRLPKPEDRKAPFIIHRPRKEQPTVAKEAIATAQPAPAVQGNSVLLAFSDGSSKVYENLTLAQMLAVSEAIRNETN